MPASIYEDYFPKEDVARIQKFKALLDERLQNIHSLYADDEKAKQIMLAIIMATNFGSVAGEATRVPAPAFARPSGGCPERYHSVDVRGVAMCVHDAAPNEADGVDQFLSSIDPIRQEKFRGNLADFLYDLFRDSNFVWSDRKVDIAKNIVKSLRIIEKVFKNTPLLWDASDASIASWLQKEKKGGDTKTEEPKTDDVKADVQDTMLPQKLEDRIKSAAKIIFKRWPAGIFPISDKDKLNRMLLGMVAFALSMSNFGIVHTGGEPAFVESNNWLLLGEAPKSGTSCGEGFLFDLDTKRCVQEIDTVGEAADAMFASLSSPYGKPVLDALSSGDIGKLAEAILVSGYMAPMAKTKESWLAMRDLMIKDFENIASAMVGAQDIWKVTSFESGLPSVQAIDSGKDGQGDKDGQDAGAKEGMSVGAKVGLAAAALGTIGLLALAMSSQSGSAAPAPKEEAPSDSDLLARETVPFPSLKK